MTIEEIFSWIACALVVSGIAMLGHKHGNGFAVIAVGGVITAVLVYRAGELSGLVMQNVIAVATNMYSFCRWRKK